MAISLRLRRPESQSHNRQTSAGVAAAGTLALAIALSGCQSNETKYQLDSNASLQPPVGGMVFQTEPRDPLATQADNTYDCNTVVSTMSLAGAQILLNGRWIGVSGDRVGGDCASQDWVWYDTREAPDALHRSSAIPIS